MFNIISWSGRVWFKTSDLESDDGAKVVSSVGSNPTSATKKVL